MSLPVLPDKVWILVALLSAAGRVSVHGKNVCYGVGLSSGQGFGEGTVKAIFQVNASYQA